MNGESQTLSFKPLLRKMNLFIIVGMIMIVADIFIFLLFLLSGVSILTKILLLFFALIGFILGYFLLSFPFVTRLVLSNNLFFFKQPYAYVSCKWEDINGYQITKEQFFLKYNHNAKVTRNILGVLLGIKRLDIPIHFFVPEWETDENWNKEEILIRINSRISNLLG